MSGVSGVFYPETKWQRCIVHFYRNVLSVVPTKRMLEMATIFKAIHAPEDRTAAIEKAAAESELQIAFSCKSGYG